MCRSAAMTAALLAGCSTHLPLSPEPRPAFFFPEPVSLPDDTQLLIAEVRVRGVRLGMLEGFQGAGDAFVRAEDLAAAIEAESDTPGWIRVNDVEGFHFSPLDQTIYVDDAFDRLPIVNRWREERVLAMQRGRQGPPLPLYAPEAPMFDARSGAADVALRADSEREFSHTTTWSFPLLFGSLTGRTARRGGDLFQAFEWERGPVQLGGNVDGDAFAEFEGERFATSIRSDEQTGFERETFAGIGTEYGKTRLRAEQQLGGSGFRLSGSTRVKLGPASLALSHFERNELRTNERRRTSATVSGRVLKTTHIAGITRRENERSTWSAFHRVAARSGPWYGRHRLDVVRFDPGVIRGELEVSRRFGDVTLAPFIEYGLMPFDFRRAGIEAQGEKLRLRFSAGQGANASLTFNDAPLIVGARWSSASGFGIGVTVHWSVGPSGITTTRQAGRAFVELFVFLDANRSGRFDDADEPLPGVEFEGIEGATDEDGKLLLPLNRARRIEVRLETLRDPFWYPATDGWLLRPRPGMTRLSIPIEETD